MKNMINMNAFVMLFLLTCLAGRSQAEDNHIVLSTEQSLTRHMEGYNVFMDFKFTVEKVHPEQDLLIIVNPLDWMSNPDILVSQVNPYPRDNNPDNTICWGWGSDICPIPSYQLKENQVFYVSVFCSFTCSFTIGVQYETETVLKLNEKKTLVFSTENFAQGKVIKLPIPKDTKTDHILIQAIPRDMKNLDHTVRMFINRGDIIPYASGFHVQGLPAWHSGVSFSLKSDMDFFCTDCIYTMLITSEDEVVVDLLARETSKEVELELKTKVHDFMFENQVLQYVLEIDSSAIPNYLDRDINIELKPFTGNPDLFVHLNERPAVLSDYEWSSMEYGIEALRITPEDRAASRNGTKAIDRFYIAVSNPIASTFSLMAYLDNKNGKPLTFGTLEGGYVQQKQIETYTLNVPAQTESNYQMTLALHVFTGNPDLYVKSCPSNFDSEGKSSLETKTSCQISQKEIDQFSQAESTEQKAVDKQFFIFSKSQTGNDQVVFMNGPPACTVTTGSCTYAVGVYGNADTPTSSHYSVLASHSQIHTILQEQIPVKHTIQINEHRYYKFTIPDDTNILSVHFQLTPITGAAGLYGAKGFEFPTKDSFERVACFCAHILSYCGCNQNDLPLSGTYYLAVYGFSHATYTLTALIRSTVEPFVIQLMEGVPYKFVFPKTGESLQEGLFRFRIDLDRSKKSNLHINLTPLRGGPYKLLLSEGFIPNNHSAAWSSINNKIIISSEDIQFIANGNYFLSVVPNDPSDPHKTEFDTKNWQFTIQYYSSSSNVAELVEGQAAVERVSAVKPAFFRFAVNKDDNGVEVKLTQFGKTLKLYASTDPENPYPTSDASDFSGQGSIKLTKEELAKFCHQDKSGQITGSYCPVYVGVYAEETEESEQEFSISVKKDETVVYLQEGLPDSHKVPSKGGHIDYAIIPKRDEDINLSITSKVPLQVYATIYDTEAHPHSFEWVAEETDQTMVKEQEDHYGETRITIKASQWDKYEESIVIIRLKNAITDATEAQEVSFTITYLGNVNYLMDSHVIFGRVEGGSYQHYKFDTGSSSSKSLKVFLTPLTSGLPELYLSSSKTSGVPKGDDYEYRSQDPSSPSITLEAATGSYYLSVFSPNNCSYSLVFTTLPETLLSVKAGIPVSVVSNSQDEDGIYLVYAPANKFRDFKVLYSKEAGNPEFFLSTIKQNKDGDSELPAPEDYQHSMMDEGFISVTRQESCEEGEEEIKEYVVFVKNDGSDQQNKATVLITEKDQYAHLPSGKSFKDLVRKGTTNYYYYVSQDLAEDEHIEISLVVYNGNPKLVASTRPELDDHPMWTATKTAGKKGSSIELKVLRENVLPSEIETLKDDKPILAKGQTLYFGVVGSTDALYNVKISVGKTSMSLEDGILSTGFLKGPENKTFTFHSPYPVDENRVVTLTFTILNEDKNAVHLFPDIEIGYIPENVAATKGDRKVNDRYIETHVEQRRSFTSRVYRFIAKKALYLINLSMSLDASVIYSINLNVNSLVMLPPNNEMLGYLGEGNSDTYQINVNEAGNLLIQFFECFGNSTVTLSSSRGDDQAMNIPRPSDGNGYSLVKVEPGVTYLRVTTTKGLVMFSPLAQGEKKALEAAYKLSVYFLPSDQKATQNLFHPGNQGKVEAWQTGEGKYHLQWDNIEMPEENSKANIDIYEVIYLSKSQKALDMAAKCQLIPGSEFVFTIDHGEDMAVWSFPSMVKSQEKRVNMDVDLSIASSDDSIIYATVAARVQPPAEGDHLGFSIPVPVFYEQAAISGGSSVTRLIENIKGGFGTILMYSGVLTVIVGGLTWAWCIRKKNKKIKVAIPKRIQYELGRVEEESPVRGDNYAGEFRNEPIGYEQSPATKKARDYVGLVDDSEEHSPVRIKPLESS